jgi:large subunit ribosomal protein L24
MKIQNGDTVVVITGKDKGKTGQVLRVLAETERVVVAGVNMRTKHVKKTPNSAGQRLHYEASMHVSNVMIVDPKTKKRSRIGFRVNKGKKQRMAKKSGEVLVRGVLPKAKGTEVSKEGKAASEKQKDMKDQREGKTIEDRGQRTEGAKPSEKKPFWKKMGFGEAALEDQAEIAGESHMKEDHSVPEKGKSQDTRSHARGK